MGETHLPSPGRTMALCGLRMMPRFPSPPPKIPYGGFSPVRLQGRYFRRGLPGSRGLPSAGLPSPFVPIADHVASPYCAGERGALVHLRSSGFCRSTPGVLAPVRVLVSRSICTYLTPCAPLAGTSRLHRSAAYTGCHRCAPVLRRLGNPRLVLSSWMFFRNMSPSGTPGKSSAACAQYFTEDAGLQLQGTVSAFPIILTLRFW